MASLPAQIAAEVNGLAAAHREDAARFDRATLARLERLFAINASAANIRDDGEREAAHRLIADATILLVGRCLTRANQATAARIPA